MKYYSHSFIHSLNKYCQACLMPGTVLGVVDTAVNFRDTGLPSGSSLSGGADIEHVGCTKGVRRSRACGVQGLGGQDKNSVFYSTCMGLGAVHTPLYVGNCSLWLQRQGKRTGQTGRGVGAPFLLVLLEP